MLKNYFVIAFRSFLRHKIYASTNILGLSVGLACCLLILTFVRHELSFDRYHKDANRVFRIAQKIQKESVEFETARVATPLIPAIKDSYPEVESAVRFQLSTRDNLVERGETAYYEEWVMIAENNLFSVFSIPFIRGNPEKALLRPRTAVITEHIAKKYFSGEDPVGKTLRIWETPFEITGVVADCPENTHLRYEIIVSLSSFAWNLDNWGWTGFYAYVKLKPGTKAEIFEEKIRDIAHVHAGSTLKEWGQRFSFSLQPLPSLHLHSHLNTEIVPPGQAKYLYIFTVIGAMILLLSCINFTNLSTARSAGRAREVGIRKVFGAYRAQVARQYLWENLAASSVSFFVALSLAALALPAYNRISGLRFGFEQLFKPQVLLAALGLSLMAGLLGGFYPAILLSRYTPVKVLKGSPRLTPRGTALRRILVFVQFSVTITLVIATLVVYKQVDFMKNQPLGFDPEQKLIIPGNILERFEGVKAEFLRNPNITGATACWNVPGRLANLVEASLVGEPEERTQSMDYYYVDDDFIEEYGIEVVAGRSFERNRASDRDNAFILNETASRAFGFGSPEEAIGKKMYEGGSGLIGTIIGVTKDFHYKGLQTVVEPLVLQFRSSYFTTLSLTVKTENLDETLSFVEKTWERLQLGRLFTFFFLDADFNRHYRLEEHLGRLYLRLTLLAIFISCLGLGGLSSYTTEQRTKEIGIRKVLGASVPNIISHLLGGFTKWVLLSNLLAWPVSYIVMHKWLQSFAYRTHLGIGEFALSGILALALAAAVVSYQCVRAAVANPADSIRYE
jgi:putative ABC transport system permease protein